MRLLVVIIVLLLCRVAAADLPDTGMGWDLRTRRLTDADVVAARPEISEWRDRPYITPDMLGDDSPEDDTKILRWGLLASRVLGVPLWINHEYRYSGVLEIQQGQTVYGNGPHSPGLKMLCKASLESGDLQIRRAHAVSIVQAPDATHFTIRDLQIDGAQYEVNWSVAGDPQLANMLANSPSYSGLAFTNQGGRQTPSKVYLDRVHVHDMPGSCVLAQCEVIGSALELGNSVGGRILYRIGGSVMNLYTYGYSRTSVARISSGTVITGWTYRNAGQINPWPENARPDKIAVVERLDGEQHQYTTLLGIDWDGSGSGYDNGLSVMQNCRVSGSIRNVHYPVMSAPKHRGPISAHIDIVTENCNPPRLHFFDTGARFRLLDLRWVNTTTDALLSDVDWSHTPAGYREWSEATHFPLTVRVARRPEDPPTLEQHLTIHIDHDWPQWCLLHIPDLVIDGRLRRPDEMVATTIRLSGRIDNRLSVWIATRDGITQQYVPGETEMDIPLKVIIDGLRCRIVPRLGFSGDHPHTIHAPLIDMRSWSPLNN